MSTENLFNKIIKYFNDNGNFPANYYSVLDTTQVLGRNSQKGDYKYIAFICPSLKGFFNWHTHVRFGIKATVIKTGSSMIRYQEGLEKIDEFVSEYYSTEVDTEAIDARNSSYYAEKCIEYVQQRLISSDLAHLITYIYPVESSSYNQSDELNEDEDNDSAEQWVYIFRHPKVKNELKIGMTVRHWKERYAEANMNTYTSRDLEVVGAYPCKDCRAVERLIHSQFDQYRLPPKTGMKKSPEWFEFPEDKVDEVIEKISAFMESIELLSI